MIPQLKIFIYYYHISNTLNQYNYAQQLCESLDGSRYFNTVSPKRAVSLINNVSGYNINRKPINFTLILCKNIIYTTSIFKLTFNKTHRY